MQKLSFGWVMLLAILSSAFGLSAFGATDDPSDASSANLVNLTYYAHPGNFLIEPIYSSTLHQTNASDQETFSDFSLDLSYGLPIPGLRISVSETRELYAANYSTTSTFGSGLTDPTVSLAYRLIDMTPGGWSTDVQVSVAPSFADSLESSPGLPGNAISGNWVLSLLASEFWTLGKNEARLSGEIQHFFSQSVIDQNDGDFNYSRDAYSIASIALIDRFHITPQFFLEGEGNFIFSNTENRNYAQGTTGNTQYPFHVVPSAVAGYLVSKQLLLEAYANFLWDTTVNTYDTNAPNDLGHAQSIWGLRALIEL